MGYYTNKIPFISKPNLYDIDAKAFFTATGITDLTIKNAINQLVLDLKSTSLWSKIKVLYPFVGGTSFTHKFNLIDTTQFQISWYGGVTHDSGGITGNGTTGYGDTNFNPSTELTYNNTCISTYIRNNVASSGYDIGSFNGTSQRFIHTPRTPTNTASSQQYNTTIGGGRLDKTSITDSRGHHILNKKTNSHRMLIDDSLVASNTGNGGSLPTYNIFVGAISSAGTATSYSSRNIAFATISESLTTTNETDLYNAVNLFQITLGRNV